LHFGILFLMLLGVGGVMISQISNRFYLKFFLGFGIGLAVFILFFHKKISLSSNHQEASSEQWMTVFVHGSFGSLLGFLNFSDVMSDNVRGSFYRNVTKKMRDDGFFYKDQAILPRGLVAVEPTFDLKIAGDKKYAAYPLIKAYQEISESIKPGKEKNYFYTFGWSGLMSQNSRRFESIRLYNALCEELTKFKQRGITPKIRFICHSHGGNLCLNLAAINKVLSLNAWDEKALVSGDADENEAIHKMADAMKDLTTKENAKTKIDQKVYDYVPTQAGLVIDELIMFGNPVQPETERFCHSNTFKRVYNFYSDEDLVQRFDWVTSKRPLSGQRLSKYPSIKSKQVTSHVVQARIMAEKPIRNGKIVCVSSDQAKKQIVAEREPTVFEEMLDGRNIFVRNSKDPTHKELWFITWKNEQQYTSFLSPLPIVVLAPLLVHTLEHFNAITDADINLCATQNNVYACLAHYNEPVIKGAFHVRRDLISTMQERIKAWRPDDDSNLAEFNVAYQHLFSHE
jgi:hypothetical protein